MYACVIVLLLPFPSIMRSRHTDLQTSCLALAFAHLSLAPVVLVVFDSRRVAGRRGGGLPRCPLPAALSHVVLVADAAHHQTNRWAPDGACAQQDPPLDASATITTWAKKPWDCGTHFAGGRAGGGDSAHKQGLRNNTKMVTILPSDQVRFRRI